MLQRLKMLSLFQNSVIERLLGYLPNFLCLFIFRDNSLGEMSHLSYNLTRLEVERPILVGFPVSLDRRASKPSS